MKYLAILFFISLSASADVDPSSGNLNGMRQTGDLVSVRLVPGEPVHFFVVGKEEGQLDLSHMKLRVRRLSPGPEKTLSTKQNGNMFSLREKLDSSKPTQLEITTETPGKEESFRFQLYEKR